MPYRLTFHIMVPGVNLRFTLPFRTPRSAHETPVDGSINYFFGMFANINRLIEIPIVFPISFDRYRDLY